MDNPVNPSAEPETVRGSGERQYGMRQDHWLYDEIPDKFAPVLQPGGAEIYFGYLKDSMSRMTHCLRAEDFRHRVREAARYAIQGATDSGRILDFDPDAMVINFVNAVCGPSANLAAIQSTEPDLQSTESPQGQK